MNKFYLVFALCALGSIWGCNSIPKNAKDVKIVEAIELTEMDKCTDVGAISEVSDLNVARAYRFLKVKAAYLGANTIVSRLRVSSNTGATYKVKGRAFQCPTDVHQKLNEVDLGT